MRRSFILRILFIVGLITLNFSCSTTKNTFSTRLYHNVTSHYNAYFNGKESYREAIKTFEKDYKEDFESILPVFIVTDEESSQTLLSDMEVAIEKATKVISQHRITAEIKRSKKFKKKQKQRIKEGKSGKSSLVYKQWIDDSYMLIGKSNFYKRDYFSAIEAFDYVSKEYVEYPINNDALMWLMRSYIEADKLNNATIVMDNLRNIENFPKDKISYLNAIFADYYIRQKDYENAIEYLNIAAESTKKRILKARYTFILAQINHKTNNLNQASKLYEEVIKLNPPYVMSFNAKINKAMCFESGAESNSLKKELQKMVRDRKNNEYRDQIYYALADIELKENRESTAITYLKESVKYSVSNDKQKALSFLKLAELHFEKRKYEEAESYYDSTIVFLDKKYEGYSNLLSKKSSLNLLVSNIRTVQRQDSLQNLAQLSEKERNKIIDGIIKDIIEKEERKKQDDLLQQQNSQNLQMNNSGFQRNASGTSGGSWYFYNTSALSFGYTEFVKKWGNRKLEDDWRRSDKSIQSIDVISSDIDVIDGDTILSKMDKKSREYYLYDIPLTDKQLKKSDSLIKSSLYAMGGIYRENLNDKLNSVKSFEELINRYPNCDLTLATWYYLHITYKEMQNLPKSEEYKNKILGAYPNSDYAALIMDPDFYLMSQQKEIKMQNEYKHAYNLFKSKKYNDAINICNNQISSNKGEKYNSRFALLKAYCLAGTDSNKDILLKELNLVINEYPNTDQSTEAQALIDLYTKKSNYTSSFSSGIYSYNADTVHFTVLLYDELKVKTSEIKKILSDINSKSFNSNGYSVVNVGYDKSKQIAYVKSFKNASEATNYRKFLEKDYDIMSYISKGEFSLFEISVSNYNILFKTKFLDEYKNFNKQYYK